MTLESIIQIALRQANEEIAAMHKATGKEVLKILDSSTKEANSMEDDAKAWAKAEAERLGASKLSAANLEARKLALVAKAEVLEDVKARALERLRKMSVLDRERVMRKLLTRARKQIPDGIVYVRAEDQDILRDNLGSYRMGQAARISGGVIVDSQDMKRRLDLSFDTIFEEVWEDNFSVISRYLFGEGSK